MNHIYLPLTTELWQMQGKSFTLTLASPGFLCYDPCMQITDTIHAIPLAGNRAYLIADEHLTLIDCGFPFQAKRIIRFIEKVGRDPGELKYIILTHHHIDHRGSARALKALTGAKIAAHEKDIPYIEGRSFAYAKHPNRLMKLLFFAVELLFFHMTVSVEKVIHDGDTIQCLQVIHTPGHTPGSISLFHSKSGALFCGDTVPYTLGKLKKPNPYSMDHAQETASIGKLASIECKFILPNDCRMVLDYGEAFLKDFCAKHCENKPS
jgi:glyoxylase-like metal-dependent hydrolase (beta-lactamase superfamily II)